MGEAEGHRNSEQHPTGNEGAVSPTPTADDIHRVLAEFEEGLKGLRLLYTERQLMQAKLQEREVSLLLRENGLTGRASELDSVRSQIEQQARAIEQERATLESRREEASQKEGELAKVAAEMEKGLADLRMRNEELKRWAEQRDREKAELASEAEQVNRSRAEAEAIKQKLAQARRDIEQAARATADLERRRAEIAAEAERVATERAELESIQLNVETAREEIDRAAAIQKQIEAQRSELAAEANRLEQERQRLAPDLAIATDLRTRKAQIEGELAELDARKGEAASLADAMARLEKNYRGLQQETERLKAEIAGSKSNLDSREGELAKNLREIERLTGELNAIRDVVDEYEQLWTIEREHAARLMENAVAPIASSGEDTKELEGLVKDLKDRLRQEISTRREAEGRAEELEQSALGSDAKLEKALSQLSTAQSEIDRLRSEAPSFTTDAQKYSLDQRRRRITTARRLIRERREKLRIGGEALRKRFEQCEKIISQRAELAQAVERVKSTERRQQKSRASSRVAVTMACWVMALAILAAFSYAVSRQVVPGVFVAKSVVKADGHGRDLTEAELTEWQQYHEAMLGDPRFADAVAKRMARKGMAETSDPGAVVAMMKDRLSWDSPTPGEIRMELRGRGSSATERELDTISTALAGEANAARTNQAFGAVTLPPTPASTGGIPIDNSQLIFAGVMLAGGFIVLTVVAQVIYRKLAKAKTKFEQDAQLAAVLDDAQWPDPQRLAA